MHMGLLPGTTLYRDMKTYPGEGGKGRAVLYLCLDPRVLGHLAIRTSHTHLVVQGTVFCLNRVLPLTGVTSSHNG